MSDDAKTPTVIPLNPPKALAVDVDETAALLSVHKNTILREIRRGNLRAMKIGRVYRVRVTEIHAYLARQELRFGKDGGQETA